MCIKQYVILSRYLGSLKGRFVTMNKRRSSVVKLIYLHCAGILKGLAPKPPEEIPVVFRCRLPAWEKLGGKAWCGSQAALGFVADLI